MKATKLKDMPGKYISILSSESRDTMIGWSKAEQDEKSGRWYEIWTRAFSNYQEAKGQQEDDRQELISYAIDHIQASYRLSTCEMFYSKENKLLRMYIKLDEIGEFEAWHFAFSAICTDQKKCEKLMKMVHTWHCSGKIRMSDLKKNGCCISWVGYD